MVLMNATRKQYELRLSFCDEYWAASSHAVWNGDIYEVYSYRTLVATFNSVTKEKWITDEKYSVTTSKFCNSIRLAWRGVGLE